MLKVYSDNAYSKINVGGLRGYLFAGIYMFL